MKEKTMPMTTKEERKASRMWREKKNRNKFTQIVYILWIYLELFESLPGPLSDTKNVKSAPSSHLRWHRCEMLVLALAFSSIQFHWSRWNNRQCEIHLCAHRYVSYWEIEKDEMSYFTFCDFNGINVLMLRIRRQIITTAIWIIIR